MGMKKQGVNFSKYLLIGIFVTVLTVGLSWFFIDIFGMLALLSSTIVETLGFFIKYFSYRKIKLIKKSLKKFLLINIGSNIAFILLSSLLIDILKFVL